MTCIIGTLPPVHIPSFMEVTRIFINIILYYSYLGIHMILQHFDYFRYRSNHNFYSTAKQMTCINSNLPPIHTPSFMKIAQIVFDLLQDPYFSGQTDVLTEGYLCCFFFCLIPCVNRHTRMRFIP